jgi:formylglycine-generating enzyme required for sulfatase activity
MLIPAGAFWMGSDTVDQHTMARRRRVVKGCAWDDDAGLCRPAARHGRPATSRHVLIGFRCAEPASDR